MTTLRFFMAAALSAAAMSGCSEPVTPATTPEAIQSEARAEDGASGGRQTPPSTLSEDTPYAMQSDFRSMPVVSRTGDVGDDCDNDDKLTLCDTDNGSSWPESYDADDKSFTVTLKFSQKVLVHPLTMRYSVFRVTNGRITRARPVGGEDVVLTSGGFSRVHADTWKLKVDPREGHDVKLFYPERRCSNRRAICTNKRTLLNSDVKVRPLSHRIKIVIPWEKPESTSTPSTPQSRTPGPVRDVKVGTALASWQAPESHGRAFITEYRVFAGSCDGYQVRTLTHPDDFWQHGGHNGRYNVRLPTLHITNVGVQAVNKYGAGPCVEN